MPSLTALTLATAALAAAQTTLIPMDCFSSQETLEQYFSYGYPWSSDVHNGGARMVPEQCTLVDGALVETAVYDPNEPDIEGIAINYRSCAVFANQDFVVAEGTGLDFEAEFIAPVAFGTWPAFWLSGTQSWPPEIDMAEWKGSGLISFNTFNTSTEVDALDLDYPNPGDWHTVRAQLRDHGNGDVSPSCHAASSSTHNVTQVQTKFFLDGIERTTQYGAGYTGAPFWFIINLQMEGSSGSPGPQTGEVYTTPLCEGEC